MGDQEAKLTERIKITEAVLQAQEDQAKKMTAYLQSARDAKLGDAQNLAGCFKYVDEELNKMKATMAEPVHKQKRIDETKQSVQGMAAELKKEYDGKIG